jgi:hypothetical protein
MKKKNTAMYELLENTGKEIAGIRRSIENLEQMLIAIGMGTCSEQEEDSPEIPDSFCGEDEMDFVNAEDQEDGILLVNPGMPYVLISCDKAMQFMDNLREPCQIILEKGGYIIVSDKKNIYQTDGMLYIRGKFLVMAREEDDIVAIDTGMFCDLVNYFSRNLEAGFMNGHLAFRIRFEDNDAGNK